MKAKCPKCNCEFETKGHSEGTLAAWMLLCSLLGIALGMVLTIVIELPW